MSPTRTHMFALRPTSCWTAAAFIACAAACSDDAARTRADAETRTRSQTEAPTSDAGDDRAVPVDAAELARDARQPEPSGDASPAPKPTADAAAGGEDAGTDEKPHVDADVDDGTDGQTPAGPTPDEQLDWVLEAITHARAPTTEELTQHFAPSFLAAIPPADLLETFQELVRTLRPFTVVKRELIGDRAVKAELDTPSGRFSVQLLVSSSALHQIEELVFQPVPLSFDEAVAQLSQLARDYSVLLAKLDSAGTCQPVFERASDKRLAIGSAFKLWVLLALDEKLAVNPSSTWNTTIPIRENLKSLPSGVLQNQPAGTELTLKDFASKMISISDNTATDHLIDFVGRMAVEAAQEHTHHSDPSANIPWFMTRELFVLKTSVQPDELAAYRAASLAEKRMQLEGFRARQIDAAGLNSWTTPRLLDLEWFASPRDLCGVLSAIGARSEFSPSGPLLEILKINSGIAFDGDQWTYVGFKGGSEPGVLNVSWLLRHATGGWFSVVVSLNDPDHTINENAALVAVSGLMPLLAAEAVAARP